MITITATGRLIRGLATEREAFAACKGEDWPPAYYGEEDPEQPVVQLALVQETLASAEALSAATIAELSSRLAALTAEQLDHLLLVERRGAGRRGVWDAVGTELKRRGQ